MDESKSLINCVRSLSHSSGFYNLTSCPFNSEMFVSSFKDASSVERVSLLSFSGDNLSVHSDLVSNLNNVCSIFWESDQTICVAHKEGVGLHAEGVCVNFFPLMNCVSAVSDPNCPFTIAACSSKSVFLWDTRSGDHSYEFLTNHLPRITCIDANPNLPNIYVTGGGDGRVMFWDVRSTRDPLKSMDLAHRHHVKSVKYNPVHDQLILSSGTDCAVNLFSLPSIASSPGRFPSMMEKRYRPGRHPVLSPKEDTWPTEGGLVQAISRHEDSVYALCWTSAWSFASLSHDGILLINSVQDKYRQVV